MTGGRALARLRRSLLLAGCIAVAGHAPAAADTRTEVRVSAGVGVENNPFLAMPDQGDGVALAAEIEVEPSIYIEDERTTFRLYGNARLRQFLQDYGTTHSILLGAGGTTRIDERTRLSSGATFQTSRSAAQDAFLFGRGDLIALEPGELPIFPDIDPTIAGTRERTNRFSVNANVDRQLSPRDVGSVGLAFSESHTSGDVGFDYRVADLTLGYGRQINERTTLRGTLALTRSDLLDQTAGDAISITPLVGLQQQVSERLNWTGQVGLSWSRIDDGLGGDITDTSLAFLLNACRSDLRGALCLTAQRQPRPTTFGGFSNSTAISVGYDARLNRRDSIGVNATYRKSEEISSSVLPGVSISEDDELIGLGASYRRAFTDRLSGFVNGSYSKVYSDLFPDREANISVYAGVSYVFGRRR